MMMKCMIIREVYLAQWMSVFSFTAYMACITRISLALLAQHHHLRFMQHWPDLLPGTADIAGALTAMCLKYSDMYLPLTAMCLKYSDIYLLVVCTIGQTLSIWLSS
jgi:hypothetical protein